MSFSYDEIRRRLLSERAQLKDQLRRLEEMVELEDIGRSNHMADDATEAFEQTVGVALQRNVEAQIESIERALARLDDGTYGLCESCGGRIDRARLEALPHAQYCVECQSRREASGVRAVVR